MSDSTSHLYPWPIVTGFVKPVEHQRIPSGKLKNKDENTSTVLKIFIISREPNSIEELREKMVTRTITNK